MGGVGGDEEKPKVGNWIHERFGFIGHGFENSKNRALDDKGLIPDADSQPTFDSHLGFKGKRKERVMVATVEEIDAAGLRPEMRDFCAHKLIELYACVRKQTVISSLNCRNSANEYTHCQVDDQILRRKEFEREKRLRQRALNIAAREKAEAAAELKVE